MDIALNRFSISKKVVGFIAILLAMMLGISVYRNVEPSYKNLHNELDSS
jgi:hypothetical protein